MATFAEIITELRGDKKRQAVADDMGISRASLEYYEKGKRKPDIEILAKFADYFGVSADYLLGRTTVKPIDEDLRFVCDYTGLSEKAINQIVNNSEYKDMVDWFICSVKFDLLIEEIYFYCVNEKAYEFFKSPKADSEGLIPTFESTAKNRRVMQDKKDLSLFKIQEISKDIAKRIYKEHKEDL